MALAIVASLAVSTTACVHPGASESAAKPARLLKRDDSLVVTSLYGRWRGIGDVHVYEVSPGARRIEVVWTGADRNRGTSEMSFHAEPGRLYLLDGHIDYQRGLYIAWITDLTTREVYSWKEIGRPDLP